MIQEISIKSAELKIIKSSPSTLGNIDVFLVIYDNDINGIGDYIEENELLIADELFEQCQFENFFVIHTTTPYRGEKIRPIKNVKAKFSINRTNCESILTFHCISIIEKDNWIEIKSGIYNSIDGNKDKLPFDHQSMIDNNNCLIKIITDKAAFFKKYNLQIEELKKVDNIVFS